MKIGILTLPLHTNYGGILQAYALQTVLERMGHEVVVIDKPRHFYLGCIRQVLAVLKRLFLKYIMFRNVQLLPERELKRKYEIISREINLFVKKNIHLCHIKYSYKEAKREGLDAIVVGSDQVWRPKYLEKIENSFLDFAKNWNIKRISYAASFGTDEIEFTSSEIKKNRKLLRKFDFLSVREKSGVDILYKVFGCNSKHVLDPTMLLEAKDYIELTETCPASNGNLLYYILDEDEQKNRVIKLLKEQRKMTPFRIGGKDWHLDEPFENLIQPSVESWIRGFVDAEIVVTDSFHACVFSIIFCKPFIVIGNRARGMSRFESLLSMFGLEDRMVYSDKDVISTSYKEIDWEHVRNVLNEKRRDSKKFLRECLL